MVAVDVRDKDAFDGFEAVLLFEQFQVGDEVFLAVGIFVIARAGIDHQPAAEAVDEEDAIAEAILLIDAVVDLVIPADLRVLGLGRWREPVRGPFQRLVVRVDLVGESRAPAPAR